MTAVASVASLAKSGRERMAASLWDTYRGGRKEK
jgi:hypothetical protein